jgi:hypothetical protein
LAGLFESFDGYGFCPLGAAGKDFFDIVDIIFEFGSFL